MNNSCDKGDHSNANNGYELGSLDTVGIFVVFRGFMTIASSIILKEIRVIQQPANSNSRWPFVISHVSRVYNVHTLVVRTTTEERQS